MAVYMLVPTDDAERLKNLVIDLFKEEDRFILPGNSACFVKTNKTSFELSEELDLEGKNRKDNRPCPAFVSLVTHYSGYAPTALWEWLKVKMEG